MKGLFETHLNLVGRVMDMQLQRQNVVMSNVANVKTPGYKPLELEFEKKQNRQIYWDDVAMFCHFQEYELGIYPMQKGDLIEIDDFSELCELDPSYCGYEAQGQEKSEEK